MSRIYVTTSIPYVNARPHLGHALELVQADVLARHARSRGLEVRLQSGTDEYAAKNVTAAQAAGVPVERFVAGNARRFEDLCRRLEVSLDDFIRTSADARHRPVVEDLWRRCADGGDLYRGTYRGRYCTGCEAFLSGEACDEHDTPPEVVEEENWFFRLSRYGERIVDAVDVRPSSRANEIRAFLTDAQDVSVSRPAERSCGWGIPVPGDPSQRIYVWFDALVNYVSALGDGHERWWTASDERIHVVGKGILRFHAALWPAILLSAGEVLPTRILVHEYLTADGKKLSKSSGNTVDPIDLIGRFGAEALRWWLVRDVSSTQDTDFTVARLIARHDDDLAGGIGNLVKRVGTLAASFGVGSAEPGASSLGAEIDDALADLDLRRATTAILAAVSDVNRVLDRERPWERARTDRTGAEATIASALASCATVVSELEPFLPTAIGRLRAALGGRAEPPFGRLAV